MLSSAVGKTDFEPSVYFWLNEGSSDSIGLELPIIDGEREIDSSAEFRVTEDFEVPKVVGDSEVDFSIDSWLEGRSDTDELELSEFVYDDENGIGPSS